MKAFLLKALPHLVAVTLFLIIASTFFSLVGKDFTLKQPDIQHAMGMSKELYDYRMSTGEEPLWSNNMFGGMPGYQTQTLYPSNLLRPIDKFLKFYTSPPVGSLFMCMLGFYILMLCLRINPWLGIAGAISFGLSTINILYLGAGHITKVNAIGYMAPALGGLILAFRSNKWLGASVFALFFGLHMASNHLQMTYYFAMLLAAVALTEVLRLIIEKRTKAALTISATLALAALLGLLPSTGSLLTTFEYSELTTRGKTELTLPVPGDKQEATPEEGLKESYILEYNMAAGEPWAMVIPNAKGGSSSVALGKNKEALQKAPKQVREQLNNFSQYWGDQGASAGAFYFGAAIMFLFVLALIFSKDVLRWPFLLLTVLAIFLCMKDMHALNNLFINKFPYYNKFRDSKMILVLIQIMAPTLAILFIDNLIKNPINVKARKFLLIGAGSLLAIVLLVVASPNITGPFISQGEVEYLDNAAKQYKGDARTLEVISDMEDALVEVRHYIFSQDAQRSLLLMIAAIGVVAAIAFNKLKWYLAAGILALIVTVDMWSVSARYMNEEKAINPQTEKMEYVHYQKRDGTVIPYEPDACDLFILDKEKKSIPDYDAKVKSLLENMQLQEAYQTVKDKHKLQYAAEFGVLQLHTDYRVLLAQPRVFSEANMPYFHKSIGGYHAAKLKRYQEVIDFYLLDEIEKINQALGTRRISAIDSTLKSCNVLNMLNTKYIKYSPQGPPIQNENNALGNAWFVSNVTFVPTADEEMKALGTFSPRQDAIISEEFKSSFTSPTSADTTAIIVLKEYATKRLTYTSHSNTNALAVFSEIYYPNGWICRLDGNEIPIIRANYILRAALIPAGDHTIEWSFEPTSYSQGSTINWIGSFSLLFFVLGIFGWNFKEEIRRDRSSLQV